VAVKYVKFHSVERISVGYLILSGLTLRDRLYGLFYAVHNRYHEFCIPEIT